MIFGGKNPLFSEASIYINQTSRGTATLDADPEGFPGRFPARSVVIIYRKKNTFTYDIETTYIQYMICFDQIIQIKTYYIINYMRYTYYLHKYCVNTLLAIVIIVRISYIIAMLIYYNNDNHCYIFVIKYGAR